MSSKTSETPHCDAGRASLGEYQPSREILSLDFPLTGLSNKQNGSDRHKLYRQISLANRTGNLGVRHRFARRSSPGINIQGHAS
jgi:hypothetical protein